MAARRVRALRMLERPPLFGLESEYPVTFFSHDGGTVSRDDHVDTTIVSRAPPLASPQAHGPRATAATAGIHEEPTR